MSLRKGLVGYWTMDDRDTQGGVLRDRSGHGLHGDITGGITSGATSPVGEAFNFDATDDKVNWNGTEDHHLSKTETWTVSAWADVKATGSWAHVVTIGNSWQLILGKDSNDSVRVGYYGSDSAWHWVDTASGWADGNLYHLVYRRNGDRQSLWIDGSEHNANTGHSGTTCPSGRDGGKHEIGASGGGRYWDGRISELRFYRRPLADDEIKELYHQRTPRHLQG